MQELGGADLDTVVCDSSSYKVFLVTANCNNIPAGATDGYMTVYKWTSGTGYITQVFFDPNNNDIHMRSKSDGVTWTAWKKF